MKYLVEVEVKAVLLISKDPNSIRDLAEMLGPVPHYFTEEGVVFATDGIQEEAIPYGNYIIKEKHGISIMAKEFFEKIATPLVEIEIEGTET